MLRIQRLNDTQATIENTYSTFSGIGDGHKKK